MSGVVLIWHLTRNKGAWTTPAGANRGLSMYRLKAGVMLYAEDT
jgi:hypothetical protein